MADAILIKQGAAGSGSDECTAMRSHVLAPYTSITKDSGDDPAAGTMPDQTGWGATLAAGESETIPEGYHDGTAVVKAKDLASQTAGTAAGSDMRKGKTAVVNGKTITGTQEDRGAWASTGLLAGQSVTIPAGIHNGSGKVTAASLASQTGGATAEDQYVKKGLKYWKDGVLRTGTMETQSAISFSAAALSCNVIRISWKNPTKGPWQGIKIRISTSGSPGESGGTLKYTGAGTNPNQGGGANYVDITGLQPMTRYYFSCTSYYTGLDNGSTVNVDALTQEKTPQECFAELSSGSLAFSYMDYYSGKYYMCYRSCSFTDSTTLSITGSKSKNENLQNSVKIPTTGSNYTWWYGLGIIYSMGTGTEQKELSDESKNALLRYKYKLVDSSGNTLIDFGKIDRLENYQDFGGDVSYKYNYYLLASSTVGDFDIKKELVNGKIIFYK